MDAYIKFHALERPGALGVPAPCPMSQKKLDIFSWMEMLFP